MSVLLLVSTVNCFLGYVAPITIRYIMTQLFSGVKVDQSLRAELYALKRELAGISMVDEFSKYAKLQRKYNKLEEELKMNMNLRFSSKVKTRLTVNFAFKVLNELTTMTLLYFYRSSPVIVLPKGTLWPLEGFFKWPCSQEGAISLLTWVIITRLVVSTIKQKDKS
ncbi:tail-anchored protein insertion receptor WRB [Orussus abietinus]|uniref:tail-anchored protein insertion receptor WRB n=1 Tax=Orussus abietinus TaxID=222816 RepID=UPI000625C9DD|nr:tail-anchored protein insertion receptor WRB [Orussus abietinus]